MPTIRTVGHGTLSADELTALLREAGLEVVVDIRRYPGSRRFPQFGPAMQSWLPERGVEYRWMESLGGRRTPAPDSPNVAWRNESFRGYADYMTSTAFTDAVAELVAIAELQMTTVMCAESVWWRCHRRLVADHLVLIEGVPVEHLFHDGRLVAHTPTPEARRVDDRIVYDVNTQGSLLDEG